jgi:hypothetical protein
MTSKYTDVPDQTLVTQQESSISEKKTKQVKALTTSETSSTRTNPHPTSLPTRVSFDQIEIREYSRCMGDNPATTHGPSLSIDWDYSVAGTYAVDEYEDTRPPRRVSQQMCVPRAIREDILMTHTDITKKDMKKAVEEIRVARCRRSMSVAFQELEDWHRFGEFVCRRFRRWRSGISKQREQELLWENAQRVLADKSADSKTKTRVKTAEGTPSDDGSTLDTAELTRYSSTSSIVGIEDVDTF